MLAKLCHLVAKHRSPLKTNIAITELVMIINNKYLFISRKLNESFQMRLTKIALITILNSLQFEKNNVFLGST